MKAQAIGIEASDAKQTAEDEQQQMAGDIGRLEEELARWKQLKAKCELMLSQLDEQIKTLKSSVTLASKKERQQAALMSQLLAQQSAFSAEKSRNQLLLDELVVRIQRKKRAFEGGGRSMNDSLEDSDEMSM
jgi:septal ring factor EnvC (AmiA/AmiB activator)